MGRAMVWLAVPPLLLALAGLGYLVHSGLAVRRFARTPPPPPPPAAPEPVSLLKPLHGPEPRLAESLAGFLAQDWAAPIEMVCGVQRADDPARTVADALAAREHGPARRVRLVVDPARHGANAKVDNLANMLPAAAHDLLILSDSDIAVAPDYVAAVAAALAQPGVGAVSCLYRGRGEAGGWSVLAAGAISYGFAPAVLLGRALGRVEPCLGSTIALRRETLARIGGFERFRDVLADDGAIGAAVRALGLHVAMPRHVVTHGCVERSFAALWRHELRWAATVRAVDPRGYRGLVLTHPLPFALLALPFAPAPALAAMAAWAIARQWQTAALDRLLGGGGMPRRWLPARDLLSFAVFVAGFGARSVDWRGARLRMEAGGRIAPARSLDHP